VEILAHGIAINPGETMGCGFLQNEAHTDPLPVVLAPGRIEAAFATYLTLIRPCIQKLAGAADATPSARFALTRKIVSSPGMNDLVLLRRVRQTRDQAGDIVMWEPLAIGDIPWFALARTEAWHLVPPHLEGYPAGEEIIAEFL
jgi:molybdopterin biosynthesis enzyme